MEVMTDIYEVVRRDHIKILETGEANEKANDETDEKRYWLRSRDKKRKRNVEKWIDQEAKQSAEVKLASDCFSHVRHLIRFGYQKEYILQFVQQHVNSFEDLLQFGRFVLQHVFENRHKWIDTPTGVEKSIYLQGNWPIMQMIALNQYMYTHASTNRPCELFQEMFVNGYLPAKTAKQLKPLLEKQGLKVVITSEFSYNQPYGILTKPWIGDLVDINVRDPVLANRSLYVQVLTAFKKIF